MRGTRAIKKCLAAALALCLALSCLPGAYAMGDWTPRPEVPSSGPCGPCASYEIVDGVMTISGEGPVTKLLADFPSTLTTVVIEEGITALVPDASLAFMDSITKVELPSSLRYVGRLSFAESAWLKGLTEEFAIFGDGILLDYNGPGGKVTVPDTVRYIASNAFYQCGVTELVFGSSVHYVGAGAWTLEGCAELKQVIVNGEAFGTDVVGRFSPWVSVEVGVDSYGYQMTQQFLIMDDVLMSYSGSGSTVVVPDTVRAIGAGGLHGQFVEVIIPETVTELGRNAVSGGSVEAGVPVLLRGAPDSAVQRYVESCDEWLFRFLPFGKDNSSLLNFVAREYFSSGTFVDVPTAEWFYESVRTAYELGLMNGKTSGYGAAFDPDGQIKLCEAVTVAARVRDIYYDGQADFTAEGVWYQPYVDYALKNGIITAAPDDWERPATRAEFASLLAAALPGRELEAVNADITFADMGETHPAYDAIMTLAKAGVMQGKGENRFDPDAQVKRSEAAAMLSRCVRPEQRIRADKPLELPVREAPLAAGLADYYAIREDGGLLLWGCLE